MIATISAAWFLFWAGVFVLADPITWLLYAVGEYAEGRGWS